MKRRFETLTQKAARVVQHWWLVLIAASVSGNYLMMRGYVIVGGVLDLLLGLFLCVYTGATLAFLLIMLGFWMLYNSFVLLGFSGDFDTFGIQGGLLFVDKAEGYPSELRKGRGPLN